MRGVAAHLTARDGLLAVVLAVVCLAVFRPALDAPFHHDDDVYVSREPMVSGGLRPAALVWMLTASHAGNWHPLTTLAHTAMCQAFGLEPRAHHALNLAVHAANAGLCFLVFRVLTGRRWASALAAAIFALHPLRVESVAWIAELKDLLCGTFWLLALLAYARYAGRPSRARFALVVVATMAALLSKPMAVTLPFTLLLLDAWPLRRWPAQSWSVLLREKVWLFALAALHSAVTIRVQLGSGAGDFAERVPPAARLANAAVCIVSYARKFFWPSDLAALYAHPIWWPPGEVAAAIAVLIAICAAVWRWRRPAPWLPVGWCWFLGTLAPALGFIQVGAQALADRYTYIPALGLTFATVWSASAALARIPRGRWIGAVCGAVVLAALVTFTRRTLAHWRDPVALFEQAQRVAGRPTTIRYWLALALNQAGRTEEAIPQLQALIADDPDFLSSYMALTAMLGKSSRNEEALAILRAAVARAPHSWQMWNNLGWWLAAEDAHLAEAGDALHRAERLAPSQADVQINLGYYEVRSGHHDLAEAHYRRALELDPWKTGVLLDLAVLLELRGADSEARASLEKALWIDPHDEELSRRRASLLARQAAKATPPR